MSQGSCIWWKLITLAARQHVEEIKWGIRVIEENTRCLDNKLSFRYLHKWMVVYLVYFVALWLNAFLVPGGISSQYSPREFMSHI